MNIVLASGFLLPQRIGPINYFRGVADRLRAAGHHVLPADVPALASCRDRADRLAKAIDGEFHGDPVHIIAHSMGGLDSRMMIGNDLAGLGQPGRIKSLTTLSTPHKGSPVADLLVGNQDSVVRPQILAVVRALGIDTGALRDLTTDAVDKTIPKVADTHKHIVYRSYAAEGRAGSPRTALLLQPTYDFVKGVTQQDNDGVVTVESARYGEYQGAWPCDHVQEMGYDLDTLVGSSVLGRVKDFFFRTVGLGSPTFDHFAKYDEIVRQLQVIDRA